MKTSLLISYGDALGVPPAVHAARSLQQAGFEHETLHGPTPSDVPSEEAGAIPAIQFRRWTTPLIPRAARQAANWLRFKSLVRQKLRSRPPDVLITMMYHSLAALPHRLGSTLLVSCIYDITAEEYSGRLDRPIVAQGWRRLRDADIVWASDAPRAVLVQERARLKAPPLVCHNCPPRNYLPEPTWPRDPWLRATLKGQGASIGAEGGCIVLRAGAVGPYGGIEETIDALSDLPEDYVFLMMGRPEPGYRSDLEKLVSQRRLERRVFIWDCPDDPSWKRALCGADIGHMIHGPFPPGRMTRFYELNSSLSNNRLFIYMAAGIPIISYDDPRMNEMYAEVDCFRVARLEHLRDDLTSIIRQLGSDPAVRYKLGEIGRAAHLRAYNWEAQFAQVLNRIAEKSAHS